MTEDEKKLRDKAQIVYMKAKEVLFETMQEIITSLATNKVFRQQGIYRKYLSAYESYTDAVKKYNATL